MRGECIGTRTTPGSPRIRALSLVRGKIYEFPSEPPAPRIRALSLVRRSVAYIIDSRAKRSPRMEAEEEGGEERRRGEEQVKVLKTEPH